MPILVDFKGVFSVSKIKDAQPFVQITMAPIYVV
jgi:hypothetical protein